MIIFRRVALFLIHVYQRGISPFLPNCCRFQPTCSHYAAEAIDRYGLLRGTMKAAFRLARCHPFHPGGYDPLS